MDLKFAPFTSSPHPGFWSTFTKLKLEVLGLEDKPIDVHGYYDSKSQEGINPLLTVEWDSFDSSKIDLNWSTYSSLGNVINHNTLDSFKKLDKVEYLNQTESAKMMEAFNTNQALEDPRILSRFVMHMFADLKKYHYYYWFAFPAVILPPTMKMIEKPTQISLQPDVLTQIANKYQAWKKQQPLQSGFFWIDLNTEEVQILSLKDGLHAKNVILAFADPSSFDEYPGWPLRNLLALLAKHSPQALQSGLEVCCLRQTVTANGDLSISSSKMLKVIWTDISEGFPSTFKMTGWEKNDKGQFAPKFANMRSSMDPKSIAESSVDLNLKLMKWRLVPELDLSLFYNLRCLLLGSGTLGCNVARCLLGWGVKTINFVDNSKVSYSNPVRQSLFNFEDCLDGGRPKAQAASEALKKVFPGVKSDGYELNIPMPGHPISESLIEKARQDYDLLEKLINDHDVIFLLMDTRESRWLPTVMAAHKQKLVMNAALGFDTFLVMRHGIRNGGSWQDFQPVKRGEIPGNQLGCYFCNDVVAPGDSTKDRTLDQQCTVTRPGVSYQAAAFAVEVMASVLQHSDGLMASASISDLPEEEGPLGPTVHSIRGSLSSFQNTRPTTLRFSNCTACSQSVLEEFAKSGFDLLMNTAKDAKYLEALTGLDKLMNESNFDDVIVCSDLSDDDF